MTKWLPGLLMVPVAYFAWCYYVPSQADRIQQTANLCYRVTSGAGGMLHVPFPDFGDLISGERENARATCAGMLYGFTQGAGELAHRQQLEQQAQNPTLYAPSGAAAVPAEGTDNSGNAGSSGNAGDAGNAPAPVAASSAVPQTSAPALPNAGNPGSL